jgi:N-acetylneuraminate synthase
MTLDVAEGEFFISDSTSLWQGISLYKLYQQAYTPWEWHKPLVERCRERGLICFSTPFDESSVDFLSSLDMPAYKIASFENTDLNLIRRVAALGKPMIISTGMASVAELADAVTTARDAGCTDLVLLKCTSAYPAMPETANLLTIPHMKELFACEVGLSDHTAGIGVAVAGVALGATVIEKHFTLSRDDGGVDASFSLEPAEMGALVAETRIAWQALGRISYGTTTGEQSSRIFRRSLYVVEDLHAGDVLTHQNLRAIRPGMGLPPKYLGILLGKRVTRDVRKGTPAGWDLI